MFSEPYEAPIVELIAELRWAPAGQVSVLGLGGPALITGETKEFDEFFTRFAVAVDKHGHTMPERLGSGNFPLLVQQPVFRFRKTEPGVAHSLYQIGPGLFTANAVPPYESWEKFRPIVERGVVAMLEARSPSEQEFPFQAVNLRYIDAFGEYLSEGRDAALFATEVLKIELKIPEALTRHLVEDGSVKPFLQLQVPLAIGGIMNFSVGDSFAAGKPAIIVDTSVISTNELDPTIESVMDAFDAAYGIIHNTFVELTRPIAHLMPPKARI